MNTPISLDTQIMKCDNGNAIFYDSLSLVYADIILEHYINKYTNTVFLCTPCYPFFSFNGDTMVPKEMIDQYDRKIFCNFDHYVYESYKNCIFDWCRSVGITDIWEWQIPILQKYPDDLKKITSFMPVRYVTKYEPFAITPTDDPTYLFVFSGNITERRYNLIQNMSSYYLPYKVVIGIRYIDNINEFNDCACVLNIHANDGIKTQEQLRIHEFLCLNVPVVSEISDVNYFGDLVTEIPTDNIPDLYDLVANKSIKIYQNPAADYKALTYDNDAFEKYRIMLLQYNRII